MVRMHYDEVFLTLVNVLTLKGSVKHPNTVKSVYRQACAHKNTEHFRLVYNDCSK